jgi:hypothetical protein
MNECDYENNIKTILTRMQGSKLTGNTDVTIYSLTAGLDDKASAGNPVIIKPKESTGSFAKDMSFDMEPYSVMVVDITFK